MLVFTADIVLSEIVSPEEMEDLFNKSYTYQVLSAFPSFTYVVMGNIILLFIVELIAQNLPGGPRRRRIVSVTKAFVAIEIVVVMGLFLWVIVIKYIHKDEGSSNAGLRVK